MPFDRSPLRRRRTARFAGLATTLALMLVPAGASASRSERTLFDATSSLLGASPKQQKTRLDELDSIGADTVRLSLQWRSFAPSPGRAHKPAGFHAADPGDYPGGTFASLDAA